ncbi:hypothetical protein HHK36_022593 [Tetracentron sinense]|uniref:Uncharacterized protein n=1 Tax=Tetracentron sinense TaxID=13715 RepID=A0A835D6Y0_TETSI|nr:hypothetical protein HHK36_022593 [Tetracentron sinense]
MVVVVVMDEGLVMDEGFSMKASRRFDLLDGGKNSWPELLGTQGHVTAARIEKENPLVTAEIVIEGTIVPADFVPV